MCLRTHADSPDSASTARRSSRCEQRPSQNTTRSPSAEPTTDAAKSPTTSGESALPNAIAAADISTVSLGNIGNGASIAIMTISTGSSHGLCSSVSQTAKTSTHGPLVAVARTSSRTG
jgi:hypothetical protein